MSSESNRRDGGLMGSDEGVLAALSQLELKTAKPRVPKKEVKPKPTTSSTHPTQSPVTQIPRSEETVAKQSPAHQPTPPKQPSQQQAPQQPAPQKILPEHRAVARQPSTRQPSAPQAPPKEPKPSDPSNKAPQKTATPVSTSTTPGHAEPPLSPLTQRAAPQKAAKPIAGTAVEEPSLAPAALPKVKQNPAPPVTGNLSPLPQNPAAVGDGKVFSRSAEPAPAKAKRPEVTPREITGQAEAKPGIKAPEPQPPTPTGVKSTPVSPAREVSNLKEQQTSEKFDFKAARDQTPTPPSNVSDKNGSTTPQPPKSEPPLQRIVSQTPSHPETIPQESGSPPGARPGISQQQAPSHTTHDTSPLGNEKRDLTGTGKEKRFRQNFVVPQTKSGEPSHRGIKTVFFALVVCAVAAVGYLVYDFLTSPPATPPIGNPPSGQDGGGVTEGNGGTGPTTPPLPTNPPNPATETKPPSPINPATASEIDGELEFLRARNELTNLADEAISSGKRESYENILKAMEDSNRPRLADAARAEALRVQQFYFQSNRPQNYRIPANAIFRDPAIESERDLTTYQKIALLQDLRQDWRTRTKAAFILAGSRDLDAADALVKAVQTDPDLNVVKEAHTTFEQNWGYRGDLFDVPPLVEWWKENRPGANSG